MGPRNSGKGSCKVNVKTHMMILSTSLFSQFDDGGPATFKKNDQHILVGVINRFLVKCGSESILTRVSKHRYWIDDILKNHNRAIFCRNSGDADF